MPQFNFNSRRTAQQRMDELERFLEFWLGPRRSRYGEPEAALNRLPLPAPLRRLHALAGRWPGTPSVSRSRLLYTQDCLIPAAKVKAQDGKLVFLCENQGVWECGTNVKGSDPPVWVKGELNEDAGYRGKWGLVSRSLSKVLVTFCLQELLLCSKVCETDTALVAEPILRAAKPIWTNGPYPYADGYTFYLLDGPILVGRMRDMLWLATNSAAGIKPLLADAQRRFGRKQDGLC